MLCKKSFSTFVLFHKTIGFFEYLIIIILQKSRKTNLLLKNNYRLHVLLFVHCIILCSCKNPFIKTEDFIFIFFFFDNIYTHKTHIYQSCNNMYKFILQHSNWEIFWCFFFFFTNLQQRLVLSLCASTWSIKIFIFAYRK